MELKTLDYCSLIGSKQEHLCLWLSVIGFRLVNFRREFLYMYGSQGKKLGQKVNIKFFTVDPYSVGTGVPRPFSKFANYWKNIFLKIKTSKIKSEKNIYQTIHNTGFIFYFFGIFTIFLYFSRFFLKKMYFFWKNYRFL